MTRDELENRRKLDRCFIGIVPCVIGTAAADGTPNVTYISHVHRVDDRHIALSRQFFNKTQRNLSDNPHASVQVNDPLTFQAYQLLVRFLRSETAGPTFDAMSARIDVIATHAGMRGVFRLQAADICEVLSIEEVDGFLEPEPEHLARAPQRSEPIRGVNSELRGLQMISDRINRATDMDDLLSTSLQALDELFGLAHSMLLHPDESGQRLVAIASRGYGESGVGAEVKLGDGLIGTVALRRTPLTLTDLDNDLRYGRAVRGRVAQETGAENLLPEIPLPGLPEANSQLAVPLLLEGELLGVLAFESNARLGFELWHESFLQVLANQIAIGIDRFRAQDADDAEPAAASGRRPQRPTSIDRSRKHTFTLFRNDDCVFVDGEYLVRNVPGKILWKILSEHNQGARTQFTNRELRLDPRLGLPAVRDNLESRLILLRKRLDEKCPDVRLVPVQRGRFALELACPVELVEREHG
ncbi:MAG: GAF domain-containing protein [Polyangiales bacterium]